MKNLFSKKVTSEEIRIFLVGDLFKNPERCLGLFQILKESKNRKTFEERKLIILKFSGYPINQVKEAIAFVESGDTPTLL